MRGYKQMIPDVRYVVTRGSMGYKKGDVIFMDPHGCVVNKQAHGWQTKEEAKKDMKRVEYVPDIGWAARKIESMLGQVYELRKLYGIKEELKDVKG